MDFAFMRSLTNDYKRPRKSTDCIVALYDGHTAHLIIVDSASCRVWAFLTKPTEPPLDILKVFMAKFGLVRGLFGRTRVGNLLGVRPFGK
jgi:hypothetical protein